MKQAINIAAQFYKAQDTMKRFYDDRYEEEIKPFRDAIIEHQKKGIDPLQFCKRVLERFQKEGVSGMSQALLLAATVEVLEPSPKSDERSV